MRKSILFTNTIEPQYDDQLTAFKVDQIPFIETKKVSIDYELDIDVGYPVIITSRNAIWAVEELKLVNNSLFVVGNSTAKKLEEKGYNIEAVASDALELTNHLPEMDAYYLCGNLRQDIISDFYKKKAFDVTEVEVYETELTPHKVKNDYDALVFLSPSAVRSYFELNSVTDNTEVFAIGNTTTLEISHFTDKNVVEPSEANLPSLIEKLKEELF